MKKNYTRDDNFDELIEKFNQICEKGYIKGVGNNYKNSCGLTFEKELHKKVDSMFFPDFKDIEIKCKQKSSRFNITLFSLSFNGPFLYENNYILEKYGIKDNLVFGKNKLYIKLKCNEKIYYNNYYFELQIDYKNELLYINIYDNNLNFVEKRGYISFDILKSRVDLKLKKLALIKAYKTKNSDQLFFKYYQMSCYVFKGFNNFLKMIESNTIKYSISLRYSSNIKTYRKNKSRGVMFSVNEDDIPKIFDRIYYDKRI